VKRERKKNKSVRPSGKRGEHPLGRKRRVHMKTLSFTNSGMK